MVLYRQLAGMGFQRLLEYRWAHMLNNIASAVFGFVYMAIWSAAAPSGAAPGGYTRELMLHYVALAQICAWVCLFGMGAGLGIPLAVRSGAVGQEMARPIGFFPYVISREAGTVGYNALYRSVPLAVIFSLLVGPPLPAAPAAALAGLGAMALSAYLGLCMGYLVGLIAFWTTEVRWAHWLFHSVNVLMSGGWVPVDILPGWLGTAAPYLPFASLLYHPIRLWLGLEQAGWLWVPAAWAVALTLVCTGTTRLAHRKVVIQGG